MKIPSCSFLFAAACSALSLSPSNLFGSAPNPIEVRVDLDRTFMPADSVERAIIKICLDTSRSERPENRPPVDLALVIDRSGSMAGQKLARAKEAALVAVSRLMPDDIFSLVAFDTTVDTLVPAQRVGDGRAIERAIHRIAANGSTAIFSGVSQGAAEIRKHIETGKYCPRIILLSDGIANVGPSSPEDLGRLGGALMKEGIPVTTMGLGLGYNEDLMTRLAERSDGNTYFVESSDDLPQIFAAELGDALNVVARRVVVSVTFPEGIHPRRVLGRNGAIDGQTLELQWNQVYGGQEKFALIEVDVEPGRSGSTRKIAAAHVDYEDPVDRRRISAQAEGSVQFTTDRGQVLQFANHAVQADYARNVVALAKDKAVELVDAHQNKAAAEQMRAQVESLRTMAKTYGNSAVMSVVDVSAPAAERMELQGLDNAGRKAFRTESAQTKNQQSSSQSSGSSLR